MRSASSLVLMLLLFAVSCTNNVINEPDVTPETVAHLEDIEITASTMDDFDNPRYYTTSLSIKDGMITYSWYAEGHWDAKQEYSRRLKESEAQTLIQTLNLRAFTAVRAFPRCGNQMESVGITHNGNTYWISFEVGSPLHSIQYQVEGDVKPVLPFIETIRALRKTL